MLCMFYCLHVLSTLESKMGRDKRIIEKKDSSDEGAKIWFSGYYKYQESSKKSLFTFRREASKLQRGATAPSPPLAPPLPATSNTSVHLSTTCQFTLVPTIPDGKYLVRAEDLQRARKLLCAQRPMKRAKFEKYASKYPISCGEAMAGVVFLSAQIWL